MMIVSLTQTDGSMHSVDFSDLLQKKSYTVLYFYPKDNTSGCTIEAQQFTQLAEAFDAYGVQIVGVSKDSHKSHCGFIEKHGLTIPLISDPEWVLHKQFGAVGEKSIRSTFLLHASGDIVHQWLKVQATGHAQTVLDYITTHLS